MQRNSGLFLLGFLALAGSLSADDWPAFRGPSGSGLSLEKTAPTTWGPGKNVKWKFALPQGCNGSPIVSNGRVFVTCAQDRSGHQRSLYCFDRKDGKELWVKTVEFQGDDPTHGDNPYCGSTPAADGRRVVVWESSAGLHCYDFEGKKLWSRDLGAFEHMWGYGTSPVIYDGKVILNTGPSQNRVFVTALSLADGKTIWETEEPFSREVKLVGSWCTPVVIQVEGKPQVLCTMPTRVLAYDPADGKIVWWCNGLQFRKGNLAYSSPAVAGDIAVVYGGYNGPGMGIRLGGKGDVTQTHRVWLTEYSERNPQSIGSGVVVDGFLYQPFADPSPPGTFGCIDPKTGKTLWSEKSHSFWGSMILAGGLLYATDQRGSTVVFKPNSAKFELVSKNDLGERTNSTPAVSNGEIFIRTYKALYCLGE
jgi:outer membrane protein assembly factor BamB